MVDQRNPRVDEAAELRRRLDERDRELKRLREQNDRLTAAAANASASSRHRASDLEDSQTQLARQTQILESIVDSSGEGIVVADLDGRFVLFNPAAEKILSMGQTDTNVPEWSETYGLFKPDGVTVFPPDELPLARAIRGEELDEVEILVRRQDVPQGRRIRVTARPLRDRDNKIQGGVALFRDITQQTRLEEQLRQAQKMEALGRFAGGIAHDFNNLLMGITGCCTIAEKLLDSGHEAKQFIHEISAAVERGVALSRQLLDFSRKRPLERRALRLNDIIEQTESILTRLLGDSVELRVSLAAVSGTIRADRSQIEQILFNLVVNARDAVRDNGAIAIATRDVVLDERDPRRPAQLEPGPYVVLEVSDNGCGMTRDVIDRAFDPFFTTKGIGHGTGLGLSTVYGFVQQLSGHVEIDSTPDVGTKILVSLPHCDDPVADELAPKPIDPLRGRNETILLVEDDDLVRKTIHRNLLALDYRVLPASRPSEAIRLNDEHPEIDLLLTDVRMPEMNGGELARLVRVARPEIKIVYMSAWPRTVLGERADLGEQAIVLQKPFDDQVLARTLRELLQPRS